MGYHNLHSHSCLFFTPILTFFSLTRKLSKPWLLPLKKLETSHKCSNLNRASWIRPTRVYENDSKDNNKLEDWDQITEVLRIKLWLENYKKRTKMNDNKIWQEMTQEQTRRTLPDTSFSINVGRTNNGLEFLK